MAVTKIKPVKAAAAMKNALRAEYGNLKRQARDLGVVKRNVTASWTPERNEPCGKIKTRSCSCVYI